MNITNKAYRRIHDLISRRFGILEFKNVAWMFGERGILFAINLFVGALVARHLGPETYGLMAYIFAFVAFFAPMASMVLDDILVKEYINNKDQQREILFTATVMKACTSLVAGALVILAVWLTRRDEPYALEMGIIGGISYVGVVLNCSRSWFLGNLKSKYPAMAGSVSNILLAFLRVGLVLYDSSVVMFAVASVASGILQGGILMYFFKCHVSMLPGKFVWSGRWAIEFVKDCAPRMVSALGVSALKDGSFVIIGILLTDYVLGQYAVAHRLMFAFMFIPGIIMQSLAPRVIKAFDVEDDGASFSHQLRRAYRTLFISGVGVSLFIAVAASVVIPVLYGSEYYDSLKYTYALLFAFPLYAAGQARVWYIVCNKAFKYALLMSLIRAVAGLTLAYYMTKYFGVYGYVGSVCVVYTWSLFFQDLFHSKHRMNAKAALSALMPFKV